jgi:hypothetical protein
MGNAQSLGDLARIMNILSGAARSFAMNGFAMVVKLERNAHHIIAITLEHGCNNRRIHPAGHGHDHTGLRSRFC